ncbi:hypothetical protein EJ02DRAFT_342666 [Clathrospora elynae]|uniref:CSI2 protein n=1 Tax=Clathrospora elynae TaxID=706981 RepID=A0A6A5SV87_9PLEO|nr:hypothetical protein EJ02DRAFT_342666 [Clathrospora elynae]
MRPSVGVVGLLLVLAPSALAQANGLPDLSTLSQPDGAGASSAQAQSSAPPQTSAAQTSDTETTQAPSTNTDKSESTEAQSSSAAAPTTNEAFPTVTQGNGGLQGLPTLAGVGIPDQKVPDTAGALFMQKSNLPDGTVFICVGAILAFFGAAVLAWRGLVAWSLHRSVKRAAMAQNLADMKAMSAVPGKKRGMYNVIGANSNMSLDQLNAAPIGKSSKPFAGPPGSTPQKSQSSLFFSPTAGGAAGVRDSIVNNRSSTYLPAGYYASGNAAPASGSPMTHVGSGHGQNPSALSLGTPGNRFSTRSSPPESPSLPPSRGGYSRAPPSRDGLSVYNRNSVATLHTPGNTRSSVYGPGNESVSQISLNMPGGTTVAGGRAPSAYLEDLFEHHGSAGQERF